MKKYAKYMVMGIIAAIISVGLFQSEEEMNSSPRSYEEILQSGVFRAVTEYNSLSYHAKGDSIEGFHYELLKAFTQEKGLQLEVTPLMSMDERLAGIENGTFDVLANDVLITSNRNDSLLFTRPIVLSKQVLIQRKPKEKNDTSYIKNQLELAHKTLHIVKGSPYKLRIENLSSEIGDTIYTKEVEKYGPEQLLAMVAHGDIDYAVCDERIARTLQKDFPQLDMEMPISFTQFYSWGVSKESTSLLDTLNVWLENYTQTKVFKKLKKKYYKE